MPKSIDKLKFQDLMHFRVHEILLVASPYDAFILEQDGRLSEQILTEFKGMNLSYAPRIWNAHTAQAAMELIKERAYDLVIVMLRISDMNPVSFAKKIKAQYPRKPMILLAFDESEVRALKNVDKNNFDNIFIWTGNSHVFSAIIKYVEDKKNVKRDIKNGDVRVILLVEDDVRYYSTFYLELYRQVIFHTKELMIRSHNDAHRLMRMRARPKILLAKNYEDAKKYFDTYQNNILGVLSDIRFPKNEKVMNSGIKLAHYIKSKEPSLPILLLSNRLSFKHEAKSLTDNFIYKKSGSLIKDLNKFMKNDLGFGDLVLKDSNGTENKIVKEVSDLKNHLENITLDSVLYHASRNHFSNWLSIRGEFDLANKFRKINPTKFNSLKDRRNYHIKLLQDYEKRRDVEPIVEFQPNLSMNKYNFTKIGTGSIGGKARGIAFAADRLKNLNKFNKYNKIRIRVPNVTVIATDEFDKFMNENNLWEIALKENDNKKLVKIFLRANLSKKLINSITYLIKDISYPLAIRSSSLSEDSQYQSLSGMYSTFMLPNSSESLNERVEQICEAIKRIYASTFFVASRSLIDKISQRMEEEKMAIIIMEMIGKVHENRFYPTMSGVAQSYNYYPSSYSKRKDGVSYLALGLGKTVVDGKKTVRVCPKFPKLIQQFFSIKSMIESSQHEFYGLDLNNGKNPMKNGEADNLKTFNLNIAEKDSELSFLGSVIPVNEDIVRDSLRHNGKRIVTFNNILKWNSFPLSEILNDLLEFGNKSLGCPVEFEFAINLYKQKDKQITADFCILQMKPMLIKSLIKTNSEIIENSENILFKTKNAMGDGIISEIKNIIMVKEESFDISCTKKIALELEQMNEYIGDKESYLLIGSGRWGSADSWLGIPVTWNQISGAKCIIETYNNELNTEPSFGSHFFHNLTNLRIAYLCQDKRNKTLDFHWLNNQKIKKESHYVKLLKLNEPLSIQVDGSSGKAILLKKLEQKPDQIDENHSSGI